MWIRLWLVALLPAVAAAEPIALRYQLKPGQELVYQSIAREYPATQPSNATYQFGKKLTVRVIGQNPDGSWQVIQESRDLDEHDHPTNDSPLLISYDMTASRPARVHFVDAVFNSPYNVFVELPEKPAADAWLAHELNDAEFDRATRKPATEPAAINIELQSEEAFNQIYGYKVQANRRFDTRCGLLTDSRVEYVDNDGQSIEEVVTRLVGEQSRDPEWMERYGQQAQTILAARRAFYDSLRQAMLDERFDDAPIDAAITTLKRVGETITLPELSQVVPAIIKETVDSPRDIKLRQNLKKIVHHPAAAWVLIDLEGRSHSLAEQKGKVVVLDFWERGCGCCLRAMPLMKQLAEDYKNKPVAFFGMNVDEKEDDARFVANYFALPYPTLRTQHAPRHTYDSPTTIPSDLNIPAASYIVQGYPTVILIDADGNLQAREVGYSPDLREAIGEKIDRLLAQPTVNAR